MIDLFISRPKITLPASFVHLLEAPQSNQSREERRAYENEWRKKNRFKIAAYSREWMRKKRAK
jgi:hypothetical protein